ncbi:MAG TPA: hypothetical protein VM936_22450 [Pyrinomonadaceae bacterium]|nr:hypothetical protein [Pyrinomonadaceae bacterium]
MSLIESSATALVRFTGLGIVCFNREKGRGEVAVIRDDKHALSVRVQRPVFQDGGGSDVIVYQDVAAYAGLPKEGVTVEIEARGAGALEGYEVYRGGEFDRLDSPDPHDFRWIVHIDSLHGDAAVRPTGRRRHPLTRLYVAGGLFYTHRLDTDIFFEKLEKDASGRVARREVFGNVGETVGVKLEGEEVVVRVSVGGREEAHALARVEGLPYRVEIKNMDYGTNAVYSDMPDYYGYLASPDGTEFDLAPMKDDDDGARAAGGAINQREFCHPIATDLDSIDKL